MLGISLNNPAHQLMPHDIMLTEMNKMDIWNVGQDISGLDQARKDPGRKVDLGYVSCDYGFGSKSNTG
jgi:hypothetical protein